MLCNDPLSSITSEYPGRLHPFVIVWYLNTALADTSLNSGVAEQYHVCSLCALDQPPKAIVGFDTPQISVRGIGSAQYTQDHSVDSSQPHSVRPPARAPPSQN